jgi:hypothetical protein
MPAKLTTTVNKIKTVPNPTNVKIIFRYDKFLMVFGYEFGRDSILTLRIYETNSILAMQSRDFRYNPQTQTQFPFLPLYFLVQARV